MKIPMLMVSAAALAFATAAVAKDATVPAAADVATTDSAGGAAAAPRTPAPTEAAPAADASTAATTDTSGTATAATPPASDAASVAAAATAPATETQSAMTTPVAADPAKAQAADQMIAQNWTKYDKANTGQLTPLEFGSWVLAAQGNDMTAQVEKSRQSKAANLPATKVLNATAAEFSKADTNKDHTISQEELKAYLSG